MKKCIKLALKGEGKTSPNPLVGCVILDENGKEISNGYHKQYGNLHAEAEALAKLKKIPKNTTIVVNLEPCSHYGKTPPCADLIISKGIKRLVIGMKDPNPLVSGKGLKKCKKAGIDVIEGILYNESKKLNEIFIKNMTEKRCFIAIKTATTLDGKIATKTGDSKWITSEKSRQEVQKIRNRYDAILTTSSTIIKDNPSINCRLKNTKNPIKIILDRGLKIDFNSKVFDSEGEKIYLVIDESTEDKKIISIPNHITPIKCKVNNYKFDLEELFKKLFELGITSILVEAGGKLNGELISLNLADKIYQFIAPKILGDNEGLSAFNGRTIQKISDTTNFIFESITDFNPDILVIYSKPYIV